MGFRPFVFRLAEELGLAGWVLNDEHGVLAEVEGPSEAITALAARLRSEAPPLAEIESLSVSEAGPQGETEFKIVTSTRSGTPDAAISPDMATCADCLAELLDPSDRRHRYPFTNCTNCGPRFTIVTGVPYDRAATTMAGFEMCAACRVEYEDPRDRRFHAQPNACPDCGPLVRLADREGKVLPHEPHADPIAAAASALRDEAIVAIKGLGGFHLACRADAENTVATLRARKHREDKAFALMVPSLDAANQLVALTAQEEALLQGRERPIVIARAHRTSRTPSRTVYSGTFGGVAGAVAPRSPDLGVMLPYSPLHHLLLADVGVPLVMTSGNVSDEPIAYEDGDALERLRPIADLFLLHDRPIHMRTDDSVLRSLDPKLRRKPLLIRRSRGYAPRSLELPLAADPPVLATGAEQKSTFCVAKGKRAWVSHHIGDLENYETLSSFRSGIEHFKRMFAVEPARVAHDLHPEYLSTKYALDLEGVERIGVQHHHAHLAACLAEHGETGRAVGAIYDGTGYGPDETVWGGEILVGDLKGYERAGLLFPVRLAGGAAAVREPWRMACSWLVAATGEQVPAIPDALRSEVDGEQWEAVCQLVATGLNSPLTTSIGRLFDAVAAICGIRANVSTEGQAAVELEGVSDPSEPGILEIPLLGGVGEEASLYGTEGHRPPESTRILDARPAILALVAAVDAGVAPATLGSRFHNGLARATATALTETAAEHGLTTTALSGGVFQNRLLLERTASRLRENGLNVLIPERLPPNDGGIAYGQAAVVAAATPAARMIR